MSDGAEKTLSDRVEFPSIPREARKKVVHLQEEFFRAEVEQRKSSFAIGFRWGINLVCHGILIICESYYGEALRPLRSITLSFVMSLRKREIGTMLIVPTRSAPVRPAPDSALQEAQ